MTTPFSAIVTPTSVSFTGPNGKVYNIDSSHKNWAEIIEGIKELQKQLRGNVSGTLELWESICELTDIGSKQINAAGAGLVFVRDGAVYYGDEPVRNAVTERILWGLSEGFDMTPYMHFLDNVMDNPSARAVDEMYGFMEKNNMGITEDGYILGYKRVRENFKDIYTGTMDNSPGTVVKMKRNRVNDDPNQTCSKGLHFCSISYLPHYGAGPGNTVIIVKVNPRDIVSVPVDYNHAKVRCCEYLVLSEYTGDDKDDLLGSKAVWSDDEFGEDDEDEFNDEWSDEDDFDVDTYEDDTAEETVEESFFNELAAARQTQRQAAIQAVAERDAAFQAAVEARAAAREQAFVEGRETAPESTLRHAAEARALAKAQEGRRLPERDPNDPVTQGDTSAVSPFDIAKFYSPEEAEEPTLVPLSEEGGDMRQIMDTVAEPHTEDGEAMRALIDVVEELVEEETPGALVSPITENEVLKAMAVLAQKLDEYKNKE